MTTISKLTAATALALVLSTAFAGAQMANGSRGMVLPAFAALDTDTNGELSRDEVLVHISAQMAEHEGNRSAARAERMDAMTDALMANADENGSLNRDGLRAGLEAFVADRMAQFGGRGEHGGRRGGEHGRMGGRGGHGQMGERGEMMGRSPEGALDRMFSYADTDESGAINQAEYDAIAAQMAERRQAQ
jgi:hypothetical protein